MLTVKSLSNSTHNTNKIRCTAVCTAVKSDAYRDAETRMYPIQVPIQVPMKSYRLMAWSRQINLNGWSWTAGTKTMASVMTL